MATVEVLPQSPIKFESIQQPVTDPGIEYLFKEALRTGFAVGHAMIFPEEYVPQPEGMQVVDFGKLNPNKFDSNTIAVVDPNRFENVSLIRRKGQADSTNADIHFDEPDTDYTVTARQTSSWR